MLLPIIKRGLPTSVILKNKMLRVISQVILVSYIGNAGHDSWLQTSTVFRLCPTELTIYGHAFLFLHHHALLWVRVRERRRSTDKRK